MIIERRKVALITFAVLLFASLSPMYVWSSFSKVGTHLDLFLLIFFVIISYKYMILEKKLIFFFVSLVVYYAVFYFNAELGFISIVRFLKAVVIIYCLLAIIHLDNNSPIGTQFYFECIVAFFLFLGILTWMLISLQVLSLSSFPDLIGDNVLKSNSGVVYKNLFFSTTIDNSLGSLLRFFGPFDEPGTLGTFSILYLCAIKFKLNNFPRKVIFLSGILSFSLAFYILFVVYVLLKKVKLVPLLIIAMSITFFLPNTFLHQKTFGRFIVNDEFSLSGDNRTDLLFDRNFFEIVNSDEIYMGRGYMAHVEDGVNASSWKVIVYNGGALTLIVFCVTLVIPVMANFNRVDFTFLIVFILSLYQKPTVFILPYLWVYLIGLGYIKSNNSCGLVNDV